MCVTLACNLCIVLCRKQRIAEQKVQNDLKRKNKGKKSLDGEKDSTGAKTTLEHMLESSTKHTTVPSDTAGLEDDDMLSVIKRRRQLAAVAAEEKKKREAEEKLL